MAVGEDRKRVWIIGAGFPRSLGAPLLDDLLSPITELQIANAFPDLPLGVQGWASHVIAFYGYGSCFDQGHPLACHNAIGGRRYWRQAEHFLEFLDDIPQGSPGEANLKKLWDNAWHEMLIGIGYKPPSFPGAEELARQARAVIAAACSAFIPGDFLERERTRPYLAWARHLGGNDTVLSFNYDRVIESLEWKRGPSGFSFHVVDPSMEPDSMESDREATAAALPMLLKLHGSVDWCLTEQKVGGAIADVVGMSGWDPKQLVDDGHEFAIATPGKMKVGLTDAFFTKIWKMAAQAIEEAREVYIIGCRLAEGDAKARDTILDAVKARAGACKVRLVLGTNTSSGDVRRLEALLRGLAKGATWDSKTGASESEPTPIAAVPFWAEDFLSDWARRQP